MIERTDARCTEQRYTVSEQIKSVIINSSFPLYPGWHYCFPEIFAWCCHFADDHTNRKGMIAKTPALEQGMSVHFSRADAFRDGFKGPIMFEKVQIKAITVVHTAALTVFTHTRQLLSMAC